MKFRTLQLSTAAACALLVSAWAAGAEAERPRTINVSGQGEIQAEPDRAVLTLGVESRKPKMEDARAEVTKTVEAVMKLTRDLKIDQKYVRATRVSVQPEYNWDNNARERNLIGYFVSRQVEDRPARSGEARPVAGEVVRSRREPGRRSAPRFQQASRAGARSAGEGRCRRQAERRSRRQGRRRSHRPAANHLGQLRFRAAADADDESANGAGGSLPMAPRRVIKAARWVSAARCRSSTI